MATNKPSELKIVSGSGKIQVASKSWCPFSVKYSDAIKSSKFADKFEITDCKQDAKESICQGVTSYPTTKTAEGKLCFSGYSPDVGMVVSKCT